MPMIVSKNDKISVAGANNDAKGHRQRLRDKFMASGLDGFQDYEVVELLLSMSTPRRDCKPMAKEAMRRFRSLQGVLDAPMSELCKIKGIGTANVFPLKLIRAVATRYFKGGLQKIDLVENPHILIDYLMSDIGWRSRECFEVIFLDAKNCIIAMEVLFEGTVTQSAVHMREVIRAVIQYNAVSIICAHNHPSGNTKPSSDDVSITKKIIEVGNLVGFRMLEHLIVSASEYFSFRENHIFDFIKKELDAAQKDGL